MKTIIIRPSVDKENSWQIKLLEKMFETTKLVDKTVCEDIIVYVFEEVDKKN